MSNLKERENRRRASVVGSIIEQQPAEPPQPEVMPSRNKVRLDVKETVAFHASSQGCLAFGESKQPRLFWARTD